MTDDTPIRLDDYVTPAELIKNHPNKFSQRQISWLLRNRQNNGLEKSGAVSVVSRKFYIHVPRFTAWLATQKS